MPLSSIITLIIPSWIVYSIPYLSYSPYEYTYTIHTLKLKVSTVWSSNFNLISAFGTKYRISLNQSRWFGTAQGRIVIFNHVLVWKTISHWSRIPANSEASVGRWNCFKTFWALLTLGTLVGRHVVRPQFCTSTPPFKSLRLPARSEIGSTSPTFSSSLLQDFFSRLCFFILALFHLLTLGSWKFDDAPIQSNKTIDTLCSAAHAPTTPHQCNWTGRVFIKTTILNIY